MRSTPGFNYVSPGAKPVIDDGDQESSAQGLSQTDIILMAVLLGAAALLCLVAIIVGIAVFCAR